jgi:ATP-dependent protease HslVU (ClpYQ) peptidase subunit
MKTRLSILALLTTVLILAGCTRTYDTTAELFGKKKKDVLVDRIVAARNAQFDARDQFAAALDQLLSVAGYKGTSLEDEYSALNSQYNRCRSQTNNVESRLADARRAARSLFHQWENELDQYSSAVVRRSSEEKLKDMQMRYENVVYALEKARDKLYPALTALKDQVLLVRHNLNAQTALSSGEEMAIAEKEISALLQEIDRATADADSFVRQMGIEPE